MAILEILVPPHPSLREVAKPVEAVDDAVRKIFDDMLETMYDDNGIGLAAPQVGISKRLITIDLQRDGEDGEKTIYYIANPEIVLESEEKQFCTEGCLSVPGQFADVERAARVKIKYLDYHGQPQELEAEELLSACVQHEIDHLNGILFVDHLSNLKKNMLLKKMKKALKNRA